ncbi:MAG: helix-turn-helix transcriptional regulator [Candidatus Bathyarchaeia archaeon]
MGIGRSTNNGNSGGMGGMMGGNGNTASTNNLWIIPAVLIALAIIGIIGFGFYMLYPEIRNVRKTCEPTKNEPSISAPLKTPAIDFPISNSAPNSCEVILKTMTPEEQKVLNTLIAHQGKYLQKYVVKEAELSRLKTHRIVARFAERGIVTVKPVGNTNEVTISDWVKGAKTPTA